MKYEELENLELSRSELAKLFGVTTRIVDQMRADGIITPCSEKPVRFNFVDSVRSIYKDARAKAAGRKNKENPAKEVDLKIKEKKLEILTNQATIEDYRVNEIKGKYHRADDIVELLQAYNETVKGALVAMPSALAIDLVNKDNPDLIAKILKQWTLETLESLENYQYDPKKLKAKALARNKLEEQEDE